MLKKKNTFSWLYLPMHHNYSSIATLHTDNSFFDQVLGFLVVNQFYRRLDGMYYTYMGRATLEFKFTNKASCNYAYVTPYLLSSSTISLSSSNATCHISLVQSIVVQVLNLYIFQNTVQQSISIQILHLLKSENTNTNTNTF